MDISESDGRAWKWKSSGFRSLIMLCWELHLLDRPAVGWPSSVGTNSALRCSDDVMCRPCKASSEGNLCRFDVEWWFNKFGVTCAVGTVSELLLLPNVSPLKPDRRPIEYYQKEITGTCYSLGINTLSLIYHSSYTYRFFRVEKSQ